VKDKLERLVGRILYREIKVTLPSGYMNVGVSANNRLVADTNDSQNWDTLSLPLPRGAWRIRRVDGKAVTLCKGFRSPNKKVEAPILERRTEMTTPTPAASPNTEEQPIRMPIRMIQLHMCDACIRGEGQECHTPGCALFLHNSPGFPIAPELYTVVEPNDMPAVSGTRRT
jgi:hypothetical protein